MTNAIVRALLLFALYLPISVLADGNCRTGEFSAAERTVMDVYIAYYGRPTDPGGLDYWATRLESEGGNLSSIIDAFGTSREYEERFGGLTNTELVSNLYRQLFNRQPDADGLAYYTGELDAGRKTLQSISLDVLFGAQNDDVAILGNKRTVAVDYFVNSEELGAGITDAQLADLLAPVTNELASAGDACKASLTLLRNTGTQQAYRQLGQMVDEHVESINGNNVDFWPVVVVTGLDLSNDGDIDIILSTSYTFWDLDSTDDPLVVFRNNGLEGFSKEFLPFGAHNRDYAVADFNSDGLDDVFYADHGYDFPPFPGKQDQLLLQTASGSLENVTSTSWPQGLVFSHSSCAGDIDVDGDIDIAVTAGSLHYLYINNGQGSFKEEGGIRLPLNSISGPIYQQNHNHEFIESLWNLQSYWCEISDLDGDGAPELILGDYNSASATDSDLNLVGSSHLILRNRGDGFFSYSYPDALVKNTVVPGGNATVQMASFDMNRDMCMDLVTVTTDYIAEQHVNAFLNDCNGHLALSDSHVLTDSSDWTDSLDVVELNDDGIVDFVTGYGAYPHYIRPAEGETGGSLGRAYINRGDGSFEQRLLVADDLLKGGPLLYLKLRAAGAGD